MKTRYAITHINREGFRQLSLTNQGRNHFDTHDAAKTYLVAMIQNNSGKTIADTFGPWPETLDVRPVECWDHGDAKAFYFDDYSPAHDLKTPENEKEAFARALRFGRDIKHADKDTPGDR